MANELAKFEGIFGEEQQKIWTTLNLQNQADRKLMVKALGQADFTFDDLTDKIFTVENIVVHEVDIESESGEVIKQLRTVLISPDGTTCSFCSNGMVNGIKNLAFIYGMPPWNPALKVKIKQQKTRRGYRTYNIEVIE